MNHFSQIVNDRWVEAVNEPTVAKWVSLKDLTRSIIDKLRKEEPDSILIPSMSGIYMAASHRIIDLTEEQQVRGYPHQVAA